MGGIGYESIVIMATIFLTSCCHALAFVIVLKVKMNYVEQTIRRIESRIDEIVSRFNAHIDTHPK